MRQSILPEPEFSENFEPNEELAILFDLSSEQMETLRILGSKTMEQIRAWEIERTEEVSQDGDETKLICRIPAADQKILQVKNEFLTGVRETIGGDNLAVIDGSLERTFRSVERERQVSISIYQREDGQYSYKIQELGFNKEGNVYSRGGKAGKLTDDGKSVPKRYTHLFAIDTQ